MKFKDKLPKLRKNNNITQEQLADLMGVSRQAVSKWESGLSIPDMEKIIELCKILNCPIDELLDDGITINHTITRKKTIKEIVDLILAFITKTYKMICSMKFIEKIKCLFELCFIVGIQSILYLIIGYILGDLIGNIINFLPYEIYDFVFDTGKFIYVISCFIIGTIITIHLFKARYLNYFVIVSDKIEKTTKEEKEILDKTKETIIIRDIKNNSSLLKKTFIIMLKIISFIIAVPLLITFLIASFLTISSFAYIKEGVIFLGVFLALIGILTINYISLEFLYSYIFNLIIKFKKIFIIFITSLLAIGIGTSLVFTNYLTFIRVDNNLTYKEATYNIELDENKILQIYNIDKNDIIIDNSVKDLQITLEYIGNKPIVETYNNIEYCENDFCYHNLYNYLNIYAEEDIIFYINLIIKDLKNKNIRNYDKLENYRISKIKIAEKDLTKIKYNF